jgi:hypothetical protein
VDLPHRTVPDPASTLNFERLKSTIDLSIGSYATELPGNPLDGQEIYYAADAANGVIWHLRYRSGASGSYKWEYLGGPSMFSSPSAGDEGTASTAYVGLTTAGPSITVPLAGDYIIEFGSRAFLTSGTYVTAAANMAVKIGAAAVSDSDSIETWTASNGWGDFFSSNNTTNNARTLRKTGLTASTVLLAQYRTTHASSTANFRNRWMNVTPVRVG